MPLIRLFLDVALFNKGPQDVPASLFLFGVVLAANLTVGVGLALLDIDLLEGIGQSLAGMAMLGGFLWGSLYFGGKSSRYLQTATAAFGCDTLVSAVALPFLFWSRLTGEGRGVVELVILLLLLWQVAVIGHVLRHALSSSYAAGFALAFIYTVGSVRLMMELFPAAG